jgi:hypothetical protein
MREAGTSDPYRARVFRDLVLAARTEQLRLLHSVTDHNLV